MPLKVVVNSVGNKGSNLGEDVVLVPLGMLRKHVDVRVRRRDKWGRPTNAMRYGKRICARELVTIVGQKVRDLVRGENWWEFKTEMVQSSKGCSKEVDPEVSLKAWVPRTWGMSALDGRGPKCCGALPWWHLEVGGVNLECQEVAVQEHKQIEVPWRTHGWLTSHTRGGASL
ncbi:unnamed protein product [Prunus brigantina]